MTDSSADLATDLPSPREACRAPLEELAPVSEIAPLQAIRSAHDGHAVARLYAVVEPLTDHYEELLATGVIAVVESPAGQRAPLGAYLIRDADHGEHGIVCAQRHVDGWMLWTGAVS